MKISSQPALHRQGAFTFWSPCSSALPLQLCSVAVWASLFACSNSILPNRNHSAFYCGRRWGAPVTTLIHGPQDLQQPTLPATDPNSAREPAAPSGAPDRAIRWTPPRPSTQDAAAAATGTSGRAGKRTRGPALGSAREQVYKEFLHVSPLTTYQPTQYAGTAHCTCA